MKFYYEKYDDTIQYINHDKVEDWKPTAEQITVEIIDDKLNLTTVHHDGQTYFSEMSVIENHEGRLIAQHLDEHMGITIFVQHPTASDEATLTLINADYIVGRYLRKRHKKA